MNCFIQDKNKVRMKMKNLTGLHKPLWDELQYCVLAVSELLPEWEQISPYFQKNGAVTITKGGPTCINDQVFEINSTC